MTLLYRSGSELSAPAFAFIFQVLIGFVIISGALGWRRFGIHSPLTAVWFGVAFMAWCATIVLNLRLLPWCFPGAFTLSASDSEIKLTGRREIVSFKMVDIESVKHGWCFYGTAPEWKVGDWAVDSPGQGTPSPGGWFIVFHVVSETGRKTYGLALRRNQTALMNTLRLLPREGLDTLAGLALQ